MNTLLLFFALPIATILLSIVLQKLLKCPILVAITFFAIYLIIAFAVFDTSFLILVILYTILAYVTAVLTRLIANILEKIKLLNKCNNNCICDDSCNANNISCINNSNSNNNENNNNNNTNRTRLTLTTNQTEPVVYLTNRTSTSGRNGCCCNRRM